MANPHVARVRERIASELGELRREGDGRSLFRAVAVDALFYFRYSKILRYAGKPPYAFFGLRREDVERLRGNNAYLCFVTDAPDKSVFLLPFARFEHLLRKEDLADDQQFKVNVLFRPGGVQALFSKRGSYALDAYLGLAGLPALRDATRPTLPAGMTHDGMQSLLGDIGLQYGFDLWFPRNDLRKIQAEVLASGRVRDALPAIGKETDRIMRQIDVIWLDGAAPVSLFEVEHTTSIYSGLLRLCDVALTHSKISEFRIVSRQMREEAFYREINRPTFQAHKLEQKVSFMSYDNAWLWRENLKQGAPYGR